MDCKASLRINEDVDWEIEIITGLWWALKASIKYT